MSGTECPTCERDDFKSPQGMRNHHAKQHDESLVNPQSGEPDVLCEWDGCEEKFRTERGMKLHHKYTHDVSIADIDVECATCGDATTTSPHKFERNHRFFCSKKCQHEWWRENVNGENHPCWDGGASKVECDFCGEPTEKHRWELAGQDHHFCSETCMGLWKSENIVGTDHPMWEGGGKRYYGKNWETQRQKALSRDDRKCRACGLSDGEHRDKYDSEIHVHHVTPLASFEKPSDANVVQNLVTLCKSCHMRWEGIPLVPEFLGGPSDE